MTGERETEIDPRGLRKPEAASYVGLSIDKFERHVKLGTFPQALPLGKPHVWDRQALDRAMDRLSRLRSKSAAPPPGEVFHLEVIDAGENALRHRQT